MGKPLWPLFRAFLAGQKGTSGTGAATGTKIERSAAVQKSVSLRSGKRERGELPALDSLHELDPLDVAGDGQHFGVVPLDIGAQQHHRRHLGVGGVAGFGDLHFGDPDVLGPQLGNKDADVPDGAEFHIELHDLGFGEDVVIQAVEGGGNEPDGHAGDDGRLIEADADGEAHAGGGPEPRGGGEALHLVAAGDDDGAGPQEADAADHLGPQPGGVPGVVELDDILVGEDGQGGAQADQDMGAEPGRAALPPPLHADDAAAEDGHQEAQDDGKPVDLVDQLGPLLVTFDAQHDDSPPPGGGPPSGKTSIYGLA